jgi:hypothetical protein
MKSNGYKTKIGWCSVCNQGWLEIWKTGKTGKLTVVCSECDTQYDSPTDALQGQNASLYAVDIDGLVASPTAEELERQGWTRYILRK